MICAAFQVVRRLDGVRSPPAECSRDRFAQLLRDMLASEDNVLDPDDYVLVLYEQVDADADWRLSQCPVLSVDSFISAFGE